MQHSLEYIIANISILSLSSLFIISVFIIRIYRRDLLLPCMWPDCYYVFLTLKIWYIFVSFEYLLFMTQFAFWSF